MNKTELRATLSLSGIFAMRLFGLFMILPIFSSYAKDSLQATPEQIGLALGGYALMPALLQLPFGWLSDHFGRKNIILFGLLLFAIGGFIAGQAETINGIIIGRMIQGGGAIGSVILALLADLTQENNRSKAMAVLGSSIGTSFILAIVLGPVMLHFLEFSHLFYTSSLLALLAITLLYTVTPTPEHSRSRVSFRHLFEAVKNRRLLNHAFGVFCQHAILTSLFIALPILLTERMGAIESLWKIYLTIIIGSFILMVPVLLTSERRNISPKIFAVSIAVLLCSQLGLFIWHAHTWQILVLLTLFFLGFNLLEMWLPSFASKTTEEHKRGSAMGLYSSCQYLGIFLGAILGGQLLHLSAAAIFLGNAGLALAWLSNTLVNLKKLH